MAGHPKDCGGTISAFHPYIPTSTNIKKTRAYVQVQGYLAHKQHPPPEDPTVALSPGIDGDPRGVGVSY